MKIEFEPNKFQIMRISKSLILSIAFSFVMGAAMANTNPTETKTARQEIQTLLQKADIAASVDESSTVNVKFMVNENNEIIVISTDKDNLDRTIKSTLNYKRLKATDFATNKTYTLPVVVKK